jgi:hypothetical protein
MTDMINTATLPEMVSITKQDQTDIISREFWDALTEEWEAAYSRRNCCEPYDCMCHEACSWEDDIASKCGGCQYMAELRTKVNDLGNSLVHNPGQVASGWFSSAIREDVEAERVAFYRHAIREGNETATHWTDVEA